MHIISLMFNKRVIFSFLLIHLFEIQMRQMIQRASDWNEEKMQRHPIDVILALFLGVSRCSEGISFPSATCLNGGFSFMTCRLLMIPCCPCLYWLPSPDTPLHFWLKALIWSAVLQINHWYWYLVGWLPILRNYILDRCNNIKWPSSHIGFYMN